jgi:FkbM family methyltransferase
VRIDVPMAIRDVTRLWTSRVPHEEDFLFFRRLADGAPSLLDVGALAGQSALSFTMVCPRASVVSFEPNVIYEPVLRYVRDTLLSSTSFTYHLVGCGAAAAELPLMVPYVDGEPHFGDASVRPEQFEVPWVRDRLATYGRRLTFERMTVHLRPLDEFRLRPTVCKIDVEGYELDVLEGMDATIAACRPIFLIENNDYHRVTPWLAARGYEPLVYDAACDDLVPMTSPTTNTFYVRPEHRPLCR